MTWTQITFLVCWPLLFMLSLVALWSDKKHSTYQRGMLLCLGLFFPVIGSLIVILTILPMSKLFWGNSATKDQMWLTGSDSNNHSSSSGDSGE
ncbi:hypothetical protein SOPP22_15870 [Shewanella sp. OPT22]|nr:hypothetical protein SOPP22_15870 [Shewanella sp. OPT22]